MMPDRVFCVDFGSAYTKVALRTANEDTTEPVRCSDLAQELWAPTVVAADWSRPDAPRLEFGFKAADIKPDAGKKIAVYPNFKRELFAPPPADDAPPPIHPLDALLGSDEFEVLATKYSVLPQWVSGLRTMASAARRMFPTPNDKLPNSEARRQDEAKRLAHHYFKWLRGRVLAHCAALKHTALNYEEIPLRVTVPALAPANELELHPGCVRLREALAGTGWKLDERLFVTEPEANAVGVLTKGENRFNKLKRKINFREMFNKGPLVTVVAGNPAYPTYRALVIDVGAFTTDFAALEIDTGGSKTGGTTNFSVVQRSISHGIADLDEAVKGALESAKREQLEVLSRKDYTAFQESVYAEGKGYRIGPGKAIGGDADRPAVQGALDAFLAKLSAETVAFCESLNPSTMQELILTGGGNSIPAVREALTASAAKTPGREFVKIHAPGLKKNKSATVLADPLDEHFARGASAIGGASIYFERAYY
jgi:hypothetical protein